MSDSGLDNTISRTPEQAREDIARKDRAAWRTATVTGGIGIVSALDGRLVCLCQRPDDCNFILEAARKAVLP